MAKDANNNNVYAGADGNVYKKDSDGNWSKYSDGGWQPVDPQTGAAQTKKSQNLRRSDESEWIVVGKFGSSEQWCGLGRREWRRAARPEWRGEWNRRYVGRGFRGRGFGERGWCCRFGCRGCWLGRGAESEDESAAAGRSEFGSRDTAE